MRPDAVLAEPGAATRPRVAREGVGAHVVIAGLAKRYGAQTALEPTDLEVQPGEFFSLLGPSGSGKSTLLGSIAGFITPSAGRILVNGADVVSVPPYRRNIGMVFQNYSLFPHMSVFDNIAFPLRMRKVAAADVRTRVERALAVVRLPGFGSRLPSQLSGGQQQRVALARAAVYDPPLLLMDEPLGALDKKLREEMQDEIKAFHHEVGATVLYVTHDQDEAATLSDRIAILNHGRIVQCGPPRELYERPRNAFVASFLGEANLFRVTSVERASAGDFRVETAEGVALRALGVPEAAVPLVACVRPERLSIVAPGRAPAGAIAGLVADVAYTAGTVRYRVRVGAGVVMTARRSAPRQEETFAEGDRVALACDPADTLIIPQD